jgi:hypothetical protein
MRLLLTVAIALCPFVAAADALTDLRASLAKLTATTPVAGQYDLTAVSQADDDEKESTGRAVVGFEVSETGLRIEYSRAALTQAEQEARGRAADPERATPSRMGLQRIRPLHLAELLDAAAAMNVELQTAQLVDVKRTTWQGKPAQLVQLKLTPKLSRSASKRVKKLDSRLLVWVGDDGVPMAAEDTTMIKASVLLMSFTSNQKHSWTFARSGDRLVATRYEENSTSDGMGQHQKTRSSEVITFR